MTEFVRSIQRAPSAEQSAREEVLVTRVLASFDDTENTRLRELVQALVRHLHAFLREVRLTEDEWRSAISYLTDVGHVTNETRQEFILLSDVFGASMQTIAMNNEAIANATEATVLGPFFVADSPGVQLGGDIAGSAPGEPCWVSGRILDTDGHPIAGARLEIWEADADGFYDVQYEDGRVGGRAHLHADEDGAYRFWAVTPTPYPIPDDGPVGRMLDATSRSPMRAAHLHFMVTAPGYRRVVTHIFVHGDEYLERDSVFGVKDSLVREFVSHRAEDPTPDGRDLGGRPWRSVEFDVVLAGGSAG